MLCCAVLTAQRALEARRGRRVFLASACCSRMKLINGCCSGAWSSGCHCWQLHHLRCLLAGAAALTVRVLDCHVLVQDSNPDGDRWWCFLSRKKPCATRPVVHFVVGLGFASCACMTIVAKLCTVPADSAFVGWVVCIIKPS